MVTKIVYYLCSICFVEFGGPEDAQEAVDAAQDKLTHDGHKFYAFQLNHCPLASPALGNCKCFLPIIDIFCELFFIIIYFSPIICTWNLWCNI